MLRTSSLSYTRGQRFELWTQAPSNSDRILRKQVKPRPPNSTRNSTFLAAAVTLQPSFYGYQVIPLTLSPLDIAEQSQSSVQHVAQNILSAPAVEGYWRRIAITSIPCKFAHHRCNSFYSYILYDRNTQNGRSCCCRKRRDSGFEEGKHCDPREGLQVNPVLFCVIDRQARHHC